ncbi:MAG: SIMPL domain-containing protein [Mucinivorans sp.]
MEDKGKMISGICIGLGILLAGFLLSSAIGNFKDADRVVSVRGLSEREVPANQVIWPLVYTEMGNDLMTIYNALESKNAKVVAFLTSGGITKDEIGIAAPAIVDVDANQYSDNKKNFRYLVTQVVTVNSKNVDKVITLRANQTALLRQNIAISNDPYQYQVQFLFTSLNDIKPAMIEEATKNARTSAEKFAEDSDSKLGKIKTASQGQISIEDRDQYTPQTKKIRVTTTIEYTLKN